MGNALLDDILKILLEEPKILGNLEGLGRALGVKRHELVLLLKSLSNTTENIRNVLRRMLEDFITSNGDNATVKKLSDCLLDFECKSGSDKLEGKYKTNFTARIVLEVEEVEAIQADATVSTTEESSKPSTSKVEVKDGGSNNDEDEVDAKKKYPPGKRLALIINLKKKRPGAEKDGRRLEDVLNCCDFDVRSCNGYGKKDILNELDELSEAVEYMERRREAVGGVLVAIMGHGNSNDKLRTESKNRFTRMTEYLSIHKAIARFTKVNAPKIFLINMCRGEDDDTGVDKDSGEYESSSLSEDESDGEEMNDESWKTWSARYIRKLPMGDEQDGDKSSWKDILVAHATYPGNVAWRSKAKGTYFIQRFCDVVEKYACQENGRSIDFLFDQLSAVFKNEPTVTLTDETGTAAVKYWQSPCFQKTLFDLDFIIKYTKK